MKDLCFEKIETTVNDVLKKENLKPALEMTISIKLALKEYVPPSLSVEVIQQEKAQGFFINHYIMFSSLASLKHLLTQSIITKNQNP